MTSSRPDAAERFAGTSRYEIRAVLGRGAHGVVYRAFDRETGREVALKTVSEPDPEHAYLLRTEFRALARITHPNLIELYDLVSDGATSFFTMELIEGETLAARLARSPRGLDRETFAALASGILAALEALHAEGRLHRDVKPSNVMLTNEGRVVLVDLGLSMELHRLTMGRSGFAGTLLYMAPEQAWGRPLGRSADWYSAAAVLWEALTGSPPFSGRGAQLLFEKENPPAVPEDLDPDDVPIANLLSAMMAPNPDARPTPCALLGTLGLRPPPSQPVSSGPLGDGDVAESSSRGPVMGSAFVGREHELAVLRTALSDVRDGRSAFVSVEGSSGMGKTELVMRFVTNAERSEGAVVLRGRCHPRESVPYAGIDGVIDDLSEWLTTLPEEERARLAPEDADALVGSFPVLGRIFRTKGEGQSGDAYELRRRLVRALRDLLSNIAQERLFAIWIDDVQWGSADAGLLLAEVFRRPTPRLLLVLSYRSEDRAESSFLRVVEERADALRDSAYRLKLAPLPEAESRQLALFYLQRDGAEDAARIATEVASEAGGHPMFLRELALAIGARSGGDRPQDLRALLVHRIERLDAVERELLVLASTAGRPLSRRVLLAATSQGESGRPHVFRLARDRLLRETWAGSEPAVEPYHGFVRDAVLGTLDDAALRVSHRAIADVLLKEPEPDADSLVDHLVGAGDLSRAAGFAEIAARRAEETLAFDRAVQLYRLAVDHGPGGPRHALRAKLGAALANAGRSAEAAQVYAEAARDARAVGAYGEAHVLERIAAERALCGGDFEVGVRRLRNVLANVGVSYPSSGLSAFASIVYHRSRLALRGLDAPPRTKEPDPRVAARADVCWTAGLGLAWIDRTRVAAFQARYMRLALATGDPRRIALALSTEASQLACLGGSKRTRRAREILARAHAMIDDLADPVTRAFVRLMGASIDFYASCWRRSIEQCDSAEAILAEAKILSEWERLTAHTLSLAALAYVGEIVELRRRQAELIAEAHERGNRISFACLASGPANVAFLLAGQPDTARRRANEALAPWRHESFQLAHYFHLVAMSQIDLYEGNPEATLDRLEREWPSVVLSASLHIQNFRVTLRHLRGRAAIGSALHAGTRRRREQLLRYARREAERIAREDVAWARPLALSLQGGIAAVDGDVPRASELLSKAARELRDLDMELHAAAVDFQHGRLLGGDRGRALVDAAESWMFGQRIASPERVAAMLVPAIDVT